MNLLEVKKIKLYTYIYLIQNNAFYGVLQQIDYVPLLTLFHLISVLKGDLFSFEKSIKTKFYFYKKNNILI